MVRDWAFTVDGADRWHRTPLSWALFRGHEPVARLLLAAGARLDWSNPYPLAKQRRNNNFFNTSLHLALPRCAGSPSMGDELSEQRAARGAELACGADSFGCLRLLLSLPAVLARLDATDDAGQTALHVAAQITRVGSGGTESDERGNSTQLLERAAQGVHMLLEAGASASVRDGEGCTPLQLARRAKQSAAIALLDRQTGC
jgi:ankyrin repeat protein|eukprot:COSAG01_NODE_3329_length_6249_cov_1.752358_1_plen_202_part_00